MMNTLTGLEEPESSDSLSRRRRGLQALMRGEAPRTSPVQAEEPPIAAEPLRGGELSRPPELERPAPLSTEAVPRAPAMLQATPLLGGQERLGAALGEAERGELSAPGVGGVTPGMSGQERQQALMRLFRPEPPEEDQGHPELGWVRQGIGGLRTAARFAGGAGTAFPSAGAGLGAEVAAGGAPPSDIFNPNVIGGGLSATAGQVPADVAAGLDIAYGGTGALGAGAGIAGAAPLLSLFTAPLAIAAAPSGEAGDQARQQAATTAALATAGSIFGPIGTGVGALAGMALPLLGKLSPHRSPEAKLRAELLEAGRLGDTLRGPMAGWEGAQDFESFFNTPGAVGYFQQPTEFVRRALSDPDSIMAASAPGGSWGEPSAMGVRTPLLAPSVQAAVTSAIQNARRLAGQPGGLEALSRAENQAQRREIERQGQTEIEAMRGEYFQPETTTYLGGEGGTMTSPAIQNAEGFNQAAAPIQARLQGQLSALTQRGPQPLPPDVLQLLRLFSAPEKTTKSEWGNAARTGWAFLDPATGLPGPLTAPPGTPGATWVGGIGGGMPREPIRLT